MILFINIVKALNKFHSKVFCLYNIIERNIKMKKSTVIKISSAVLVIITLLSSFAISTCSYYSSGDPAECPMKNGVLNKDNDQLAKEIAQKYKKTGKKDDLKNSVVKAYLDSSYNKGWKSKALDSYINYMRYEFMSGECYYELCKILTVLCDSINKNVSDVFNRYGKIEQLLTLLNCGGRKDKLIEFAVENSCNEMRSTLPSRYYNELRSLCETAEKWARKELGKYKKSSLLTN